MVSLQKFFDVSQASDVQTLRTRLLGFAADLNFPLVQAALIIDQPGKAADIIAIGNTPEGFAEAAHNVDSSHRDPVLGKLKTMNVPFIYDQGLYVAAGAGDLWEEQAPFGYKTGVAVALHLPDHRHFLLGLDRSDALDEHDESLTRLLANLQLLAVHAQDAACRLLSETIKGPVPEFSPRELEILRWTMDGKSAWAVGQILGISEHTVNHHLRFILRKLDSSTKHQAVLRAIALGVLRV